MIENYNLEIDRIIKKIEKKKAKRILIQIPDGLKREADKIVEEIEKKAGKEIEILIWLGSCYGACDIPQFEGIDKDIDLIIQFGHSEWG